MGPLSGLKVLDLSRVLAGPWAGQLLADLGADVIKVEKPGDGDDTRSWGPACLKDSQGNATRESAYFLSANRGKRSIAVDIRSYQGQGIIRKLAQNSDIIIENYKVGGLAKYGLDYETIKEINPAIIYCSVTGFGQDGPYAERAGYDFMIQAMGGLMSITGERAELGGGPQKVGVAISDITTGLYATIAILGAVRHRDQTGEGQYIDMSLLDVTAGLLANQNMNYLVGGTVPQGLGNAHPNIVPYQSFKTADGHIVLTIGNDRQFRAFLNASNRADLIEDDRFHTNNGRVENREILIPILNDILLERTTSEWGDLLEEAHVPCGPINTIEDVFNDPQIKHRNMQIDLDHGLGCKVPQVATPIKYSETKLEYKRPPPMLGADTQDVLKENGWSDDDISGYMSRGVISGINKE